MKLGICSSPLSLLKESGKDLTDARGGGGGGGGETDEGKRFKCVSLRDSLKNAHCTVEI